MKLKDQNMKQNNNGENHGINFKDNQIEDLKNQIKEKDLRISNLEKENNLLKQNEEVTKIKDDEIKKN